MLVITYAPNPDSPATAVAPEPIEWIEMREFMAGDDPPVDADPVFRQRLREELWTMLAARPAESRG